MDDKSVVADIKTTFEKEGYIVKRGIGSSNFKIDLAIVDPKNPEKYLLGIECDGGSYKDATSARDRDNIRPGVLRGLGWKLIHLFSPIWFNEKQETVKEIKKMLNSS